jgi:hypothetical protein
MNNSIIHSFLQSASLFVMLIVAFTGKAQIYTTLLKQKLPIKEDALGDHATKFILADNKLLLLSRVESKKYNSNYIASYLSYDIVTGKKSKARFIADSAIFEYVDIDNTVHNNSKEVIFIKVNEFERIHSNIYSSALYIFTKIDAQTYKQIDIIKDFQQYEGKIHQLDENRVLFYKNYDYHPLDDSMPTITSIYNFSQRKFDTITHETFNGIYLTNLVNNLFAATNTKIYKAYPVEKLIRISDNRLNLIDTFVVPVQADYSEEYSTIDSLKKAVKFKKDFIKKAKEIDYSIERIESMFMLNQDILCVVLKPKYSKNFTHRRLLYYDAANYKLLSDEYKDYTNSNSIDVVIPNLTYNNPFVIFNEATNSLLYISKNQYVKGNKIKGSNRYSMYVLKFNHKYLEAQKLNIGANSNTKIASTQIFNLRGDTIDINKLFLKKSIVLIQNQRICQPCVAKAYTFINTQYPRYSKYVVLEYNENLVQLLSHEKRIKKAINPKEIYYYKTDDTILKKQHLGIMPNHTHPNFFENQLKLLCKPLLILDTM